MINAEHVFAFLLGFLFSNGFWVYHLWRNPKAIQSLLELFHPPA